MDQDDHLEIFQRIRSSYTDLSPSFRKLADFLTGFYRDAAFLPAAQVASRADVSESVVVRFAGALGYSGYPEMLRAIQRIVKSELSPSRRLASDEPENRLLRRDVLGRTIATDVENLQRTAGDPVTRASFERAASMLANAAEVYSVGLRRLGSLATMFGLLLRTAGVRTEIVTHGHAEMFEQLYYIRREHVLVAFAFQRYTKRTVDAIELANSRGASSLVITDSLTSPAARAGNVSLICSVKAESFFNSYTAAVSLINAITTAVVDQRLRATRRALEDLDDLLPDEDFFGPGTGS